MKLFPAMVPIAGRRVVVLGGGVLASRKARLLLDDEVDLVMIARAFDEETRSEFADRVTWIERAPRAADLDGAVIAIVAEEDETLTEAYARLVRRTGIPLNVVDRPELSDFQTPSIVDRGDVVVAIGTGGAAPVLGRQIRAAVDRLLPARLGDLAGLARSLRPLVAERLPFAARRAFWERVLSGPAATQCLNGDIDGARAAMVAALENPDACKGVVHIVGAGPGDPELLTIRAQRLLQEADVIIYDRLVSDDILSLARRDADRIYVGKAKSNHSCAQGDIEQLLIDHAKQGRVVVRLKGGDPFIFGRGGEELETVRAAGVDVYVTPGITAALGCAASAGIALTHRDHTQAVTFVTGHAKTGTEPNLDWNALAKGGGTIVFYMGVSQAETIAARLIANGLDTATPVAIIENGTRADQTITPCVLSALGETADAVRGPAILIIGSVASMAGTGDHGAITSLAAQATAIAA